MKTPSSKSSSSQTIVLLAELDTGLLVTWIQPSSTVPLLGIVKPSTTLGLPLLVTTAGPDQFETPAFAIGAKAIRNEMNKDSLNLLCFMPLLVLGLVMNESVRCSIP